MIQQYNTATLRNGLRVIQTNSATDVVYCGYAINAGTRDELAAESGMAHFCEHMLFKGTSRRKSHHILNRMEHVGGDINAYTNKEETVVYSAFLKPHFARAVDLLTDIVFGSLYPQAEIEKEVEVIADEIRSYEDSPHELIYDDFEQLVYSDHALGRNILGDPLRLRQYTTADALEFIHRNYHPSNAIFFVYGNIDFKRAIRLLESAMDKIDFSEFTPSPNIREVPAPYLASNLMIKKDTHQAHVMMGGRGYSAHDPKRFSLYMLNNILGGPGMNSRLNVCLREKHGLVYNVESNMSSYTDSGAFCIYFGCDIKDVDRCCSLVRKELNRLSSRALTSYQFAAAQKQLIGQIGVSCDNFESFALSAGKEFLHHNRCKDIESLYRRIESLTTLQLQEVAEEIFSLQNISTLIYK